VLAVSTISAVGLGIQQVLDHLGGVRGQDRVACQAGGVENGFGDAGLSQAGTAEAKHVAVFLQEAAGQQ
jgi:hypothetical protein